MTARQIFESLLTELSKVKAPSMLLSDFNYYMNKAVNQYINKRYNLYDVNQQTTDDIRVLKSTAILDAAPVIDEITKKGKYGTITDIENYKTGEANLFGATYIVNLPDDYLHMLNCVCVYELTKDYKCYDKGNVVQFPAKRLTADAWSTIVTDYYNRPLPERPYYYIHNVNTSTDQPTNPLKYNPVTTNDLSDLVEGTDAGFNVPLPGEYAKYKVLVYESTGISYQVYYNSQGYTFVMDSDLERADRYHHCELSENLQSILKIESIDQDVHSTKLDVSQILSRTIKFNNNSVNLVDKPEGLRVSNASKVRCEIRYGKDNSVFKLKKVFIDYIKSPQVIRLTQEQVDLTTDTSQIIEFPDYVCQEIINELVMLVMAKDADPRLQTTNVVNQSIAVASPQQEQQT